MRRGLKFVKTLQDRYKALEDINLSNEQLIFKKVCIEAIDENNRAGASYNLSVKVVSGDNLFYKMASLKGQLVKVNLKKRQTYGRQKERFTLLDSVDDILRPNLFSIQQVNPDRLFLLVLFVDNENLFVAFSEELQRLSVCVIGFNAAICQDTKAETMRGCV